MTVILTLAEEYSEARPFLLDWGGVVTSPIGGASQRLNRLGNRWGLEVLLPRMHYATAMAWVAKLNQGLKEGVLTRFPQPGFTPPAGSALINGAGQSGSTLNVDGQTPGYAYKAGQFINAFTSGQRFLYQLRADGVFNGSGAAALPIFPELRAVPDDNSAVEMPQPVIEGFLDGDGRDWTIDTARTVGLGFTVIEQR